MSPRGKGRDPLAPMFALALAACAGTALTGMASALVYTDHEPLLRSLGLTLQHLRPLHESLAFAWVFLGGVSVVYLRLCAGGPLPPGSRARLRIQVVLWTAAGVGIGATVLGGRFTGREYQGYSPVFSALIVAGWILFAWNYFARTGLRLADRPVYLYMWSAAIPLFFIAFAEAHLYLLEPVTARPLRDLALQWKSSGTLVGCFNQIAYGALLYIASRVRGDESYAHSRTAFALFSVGLLNTFTNYGHHTYHLPQSPWIHWISFVVSMLEVIILAKLLLELVRPAQAPADPSLKVPAAFLRSATLWQFAMLALAILISVPPLNTLIHGTHVVVAHSMGAMIGIDSMILWACVAWWIRERVGPRHPAVAGGRVRGALRLLNVSLAVFWVAFLAHGAARAWMRYTGPAAPDFSYVLYLFPGFMALSGLALGASILWIVGQWLGAMLGARTPVEVEVATPLGAANPSTSPGP